MENFLVLMNSIIDSWMSPSTMAIAMDMSIGIMCGVGLFLLLIPFLKEYPVSSASGSKRDIPKDVKRRRKKTRKKAATGKGCRDGGKDREETKTPSQPKKKVTMQLFQDFIPQPFWNPNQNMEHLQLPPLFSYLKVLENLMQHNFRRLFWGISSIFSESVVATVQIFRRPALVKHKSVRFSDSKGPVKPPSQGKATPQSSRYQPLPHQLVTPKLIGEKQVQGKKILPSSTSKQIPPCFKSRASEVSCPTERRIQSSLPIKSLSQKHGLYSQYTKSHEDQNPISTPTGSLRRSILPINPIRTASNYPEHCRMLQHHEEPQNTHKTANIREQLGAPIRFLPFRKLTQLQGHSPANKDHYSKSRPQLFQPAQPSILNAKDYNCSRMMGTAPTGLALKEDTAKCNVYNTIKKFLGLGAKKVPCTSSSSPGEGLKPRNPSLRTDNLSCLNPGELRSMLDTKTEKRLAPNITAFPVKRRTGPYLQILEARDLAPPGVPASKLPQVVYPSLPICDPKAEYYPKAAMALENLHHQDPGGTLVDCASAARLQRAGSIPAELQETQRARPPAASLGVSKAHPDPQQRCLSVRRPASYFQAAHPHQSRTIRGIGKGSPQPNTNLKMAKHVPQKSFQEVDSGIVTMVRPVESVPTSAVKEIKTAEVKEEPLCTWNVSLRSSEIHSGQDINMSPRVFGSLWSNRSPVHLQTPTPQNSQDSTQKTQGYSNIILSSDKQPEAWPVRHHPDGPSTVHPAKVSLPSQHSLPIFQNTCQNPKTSQGLCDVFMRRPEKVDTQENRVLKDKIKGKGLKGVHPHEERQSTIRPRAISQGESLGRVRPSMLSSTQPKDTTKTQIPGKGEATCKSSWKNTTRNAVQERNLSTNYTRQRDPLKTDHPPVAAEQTQEVLTRKKVICSMISELQSLVNVLSQIVKNNERDTSKVNVPSPCSQGESLTSQLGGLSHASKAVYDTTRSRAASRRSCGHTSPQMHNYPFTYRGIRDNLLTGTEVQRVCDQHLNKEKRETGFDQLHMPKGKELCGYRGIGDKQESCLADKRNLDPGKIVTNIVMDHGPHRSPKGHKHSFTCREIGDEQQSGVDHKAFDPHQSTKKEMGSGYFQRLKENHPVKHGGIDCSWPSTAAQRAFHPR